MADAQCHDICPDCGKVRYSSREQALISAAKQFRRRTARTYRCGRYWHLTRWPWEAFNRR